MPEGISETAFDLEDVATEAADIFGLSDSDEDASSPDEHLDTEEVDEAEGEDLEDDADDELDLGDEEDEDPDNEDEVEDEDLEDDEEDDDLEDEDDEDLEDDEDEESEEDDLYTVKVQGEEFQVPLQELVSGYQRQQDYTLKTQQVSAVYQKMADWYETRANDPEFWVQEIASGQEDPAATIAGAIRKTGNATVLLGQTLKHLVESGEIADELVEALNLQQVAEQAKDESLHLKVQSLQDQIQQRDQQAQEQQTMSAVTAEIQNQWAQVVQEHGLDPNDAETYYKALEFARDNGIPNLVLAYRAMNPTAGVSRTEPAKQKKRKKAESAVKKRKTSAMSRKPAGGGSPSSTTSTKAKGDPVADAAASALSELESLFSE